LPIRLEGSSPSLPTKSFSILRKPHYNGIVYLQALTGWVESESITGIGTYQTHSTITRR
jgi:hypothetical protein